VSTDDLDPVQLDDELINALVYHQCGRESCCVSTALAAWQREIDAKPISQLDVDEALAVVVAGRHRRAGFWSQLRAALARDRWPWRKGL